MGKSRAKQTTTTIRIVNNNKEIKYFKRNISAVNCSLLQYAGVPTLIIVHAQDQKK